MKIIKPGILPDTKLVFGCSYCGCIWEIGMDEDSVRRVKCYAVGGYPIFEHIMNCPCCHEETIGKVKTGENDYGSEFDD